MSLYPYISIVIRHVLGLLILVALLCVHARAGSIINISAAPEIWYVKWQPSSKDPEYPQDSYGAYNVAPSVLYGVTVSALYGGTGIAGSYLMSHSEKEIMGRAGAGRSTSLVSQLRSEITSHLGAGWYARNRIVYGRFKGSSSGVEWDELNGASIKDLPINTAWIQGDLLFIDEKFDWQKSLREFTGAAAVFGYRFQQYTLPAEVHTYFPDSSHRISFLDTTFTINQLIIGLENMPDERKGWNLEIQRMTIGMGATTVRNSLMHETSWSNGNSGDPGAGSMSMSLEFDAALARKFSAGVFELGMRYRSATNIVGKGRPSGNKLYMEDYYWGPYSSLSLRFN